MRNLKKILALVLALVMSLSLMATAGAESFKDVTDDNPYKTAIDVLTELKVVKGYGDGNFQPDGQLNRAEAAVLVYRIATGDVEDKYLDNYTFMQQSKFTDLDGYNWAKGYINYCQNAGIVVGTDATHFNPGGKVTGYQLLVMLLRTLGYGKAGEFADPKGWELQTAAIAEREGITANVTTGDFGAPAPRAMVAELLFRGLLTETVTYSALVSGGYTKGETLGKREFGLEEIEGVVTANEWANLTDGEAVLKEGQTEITTADKTYTVDRTTPITDIGENFAAYIAKSKVLTIENTGNTVWEPENGKGVDISSNAKFEKETGMKKNSDTEYFINFEGQYANQSEWVLRYRVKSASPAYTTYLADLLADKTAGETIVGDIRLDNGDYVRTFQPKTAIPQTDINIMREIFYTADRTQDNPANAAVAGFVVGEVYAGTSSLKDLSDSKSEGGMSWDEFTATYLKPIDISDINGSENGDWLKVIDNDGDGYADYVFYTWYWLDEVVSSYQNKAGDTVMQYYAFDDDDNRFEDKEPTIYMDGTDRAERDVEVGTVVLAAEIDGQILVSKADNVTKTVEKYVWKTDEITTTDGETYGQSFIGNETPMQQNLGAMDEKTEYLMHLDKFGYVRAYELPGGTKYALVTELYYTNNQNGNLQQNWPMTVELTMPNDAGEAETNEYNLSNPGTRANPNPFIGLNYWTMIDSPVLTADYENWLQPAIAHLGTTGVDRKTPTLASTGLTSFWPLNRQLVRPITSLNLSTEFNYGTAVAPDVSFTNVAVVNVNDNEASIQGAAQREVDRNGAWTGRYDVDYIQLSTADIAAKSVRYAIDAGSAAAENYYVNAVHDTEYYIAYNGGVYYVKDYANFPGLTNAKNNIHAAYAVARDTSSDNSDKPYWVADVIVYEVENWNDDAKSNISLVYYDYSRTTGQVYLLNTLNNKSENAMIDVVPEDGDSWFNSFVGWGFYDLYNTKTNEDGTMTARKLSAITSKFNDNGIYAGVITREVYIANGGAYIDVNLYGKHHDLDGDGIKDANESWVTDASIKLSSNIYSITADRLATSGNTYNEANALQYSETSWSEVKKGDRVMWVGGAKGTGVSDAAFIVDLSHGEDPVSYDNTIYWNTAEFLGWHGTPNAANNWNPDPVGTGLNIPNSATPTGALWRLIWNEQINPAPTVYAQPTVNFFNQTESYTTLTNSIPYKTAVDSGKPTVTVTYNKDNKAIANVTVNGVQATKQDDGLTWIYDDPAGVPTSAKTYTVSVTYQNGKDNSVATTTWNLTVANAGNGAKFAAGAVANKDIVKTAAGGNNSLNAPDAGTTGFQPILKWLQTAKLDADSQNASVKWTIEINNGTPITVTGTGVGDSLVLTPATWNETSNNVVTSVKATVTSADGKLKTNYSTGTAAAVGYEVTVLGNNIEVFDKTWTGGANPTTDAAAKVTLTNGKFTVPYGDHDIYYFVAEGQGTWNVTGSTQGMGQELYCNSMTNICREQFFEDTTIGFTPTPADQVTAVQILRGTNVVKTGATTGQADMAKRPKDAWIDQDINLVLTPSGTEKIRSVQWQSETASGYAVYKQVKINAEWNTDPNGTLTWVWQIPAGSIPVGGTVFINAVVVDATYDLTVDNTAADATVTTTRNLVVTYTDASGVAQRVEVLAGADSSALTIPYNETVTITAYGGNISVTDSTNKCVIAGSGNTWTVSNMTADTTVTVVDAT